MAPFTVQPHAAPFKPCAVPFKWQPVVIEKPAMHQNNQEDELSHMRPRSALYDCPIWAPFNPIHHSAPFKPHVAPFKWQPVVREKRGRYQNDQHDKPSHMGPRSALYKCPIWAPFNPIHCSALCGPVQALYGPIHHSALCRSPIQRR